MKPVFLFDVICWILKIKQRVCISYFYGPDRWTTVVVSHSRRWDVRISIKNLWPDYFCQALKQNIRCLKKCDGSLFRGHILLSNDASSEAPIQKASLLQGLITFGISSCVGAGYLRWFLDSKPQWPKVTAKTVKCRNPPVTFHTPDAGLENDLGSEVLLLAAVVAHAHLQHPFWLHHLHVLHVPLPLV